VELALRTLELRASIAGPGRFDVRDVRTRQPSRIQGLEWRYEVDGDWIRISLRDGGGLTEGTRPLAVSVPLTRVSPGELS
jgi:hypothetical protein